jgi:hypothetical protein
VKTAHSVLPDDPLYAREWSKNRIFCSRSQSGQINNDIFFGAFVKQGQDDRASFLLRFLVRKCRKERRVFRNDSMEVAVRIALKSLFRRKIGDPFGDLASAADI